MDFEAVIETRHSCRAFQNKEVEREKIQKILEVICSAPSAGNLQSYEVIVMQNKHKKEELAKASTSISRETKQSFIFQAPLVLVFLADQDRSEHKYGARGKELYSIQDATIAASYAQLAATSLGLSSVWVGSFDSEEVSRIINKGKKVPIAIIPIGYPAEELEIHEKRRMEDLISYLE